MKRDQILIDAIKTAIEDNQMYLSGEADPNDDNFNSSIMMLERALEEYEASNEF